ncbi:MAG TPA: ATP synthase F1 subunit delta [Candidatus Binatia bacterium]|nr:ATP synthase F1 subunit delta [Candidatus Binatia bacterium]
MIEGSLSRRYTKALFQLAHEAGQEEKIGQEIESFLEAYTNPLLQKVLTNPAFKIDSRKRTLIEVSNSLKLSRLAIHFLLLLLERDRLAYLPSIAALYRRLLNEAQGRLDAKVVSAGSLEPSIVDRLREVLHGISGKEIVLQQEMEPALIGGVLVEFEGKVYDGSVRTQLEKMKERVMRGY